MMKNWMTAQLAQLLVACSGTSVNVPNMGRLPTLVRSFTRWIWHQFFENSGVLQYVEPSFILCRLSIELYLYVLVGVR